MKDMFDWLAFERRGFQKIFVDPTILELTNDLGSAVVLDMLMWKYGDFLLDDGWIDMEALAGMTRPEMQDTWIWTAIKRLEREGYIELQPYSRFIENQRFELRLTQKFFDDHSNSFLMRTNNET